MGKKSIVLFSGGIDSLTIVVILKSLGIDVYTISFDYGQKNKNEIMCIKELLKKYNIQKHIIIPIDCSALFLKNDSYIPARNLIFLSMATGWAEKEKIEHVYIGVNKDDFNNYPDCKINFIKRFEETANIGIKGKVEIHTPLIDMNKYDIIKRGLKVGIDYSYSTSCLHPTASGLPCGGCVKCITIKNVYDRIKKEGEKMGIIKSFKGAFNRDVIIELIENKCSVCGENKLVIGMDGSDGEYTEPMICRNCINKAFLKGE